MSVSDQAASWTAEMVKHAVHFDQKCGGPDWLRALRQSGRERLSSSCLPIRRDEEWAYTNVRPLLGKQFNIGETSLTAQTQTASWQPLGTAKPPAATANAGGFPEHAFTAINQAFSNTGVCITVNDDEPGLIEIVHRALNYPDGPVLFTDNVRVELAPGAQATVLERWEPIDRPDATLHVPAADFFIAPRAKLRYYRHAPADPLAFSFASLRAAVCSDASLDLVLIGSGMAIDRTETTVALQASGAQVRLEGSAVLSGSLHNATHTCVHHKAPNCSSDQLFKTVLLDGARSSFQGTIEVDQTAQGTDAFQLSKTLLLDPTSRSDARPQLRIGADQVRCTHGATAGPLAPEQLNYLLSRGIPTGKATGMLVRGFLNEVTRRVDIPEVSTLLNRQVNRSLAALEAA